MRSIEWTDRRGQTNVLVLDHGLTFHVDPVPEPHAFDPEIRRYMNGPENVEHFGPCLGCLPYRFPEQHPIHDVGSGIGSDPA